MVTTKAMTRTVLTHSMVRHAMMHIVHCAHTHRLYTINFYLYFAQLE